MYKRTTYPQCENKTLNIPEVEISEETIEALLQDRRVLPLYELKYRDYIERKRFSMTTNEKLKCRWGAYKDMVTAGGWVHRLFMFPRNKDIHFVNYKNCYHPSQSTDVKPSYKYQVRAGPGFDDKGELPILDDTSLRPKLKKRPRTPKSPQIKTIFKNKLTRK